MGMLSFDKRSESHMAIISYENEHDWNSFQMEYRKGVLIIHASRNMDIIIG